METLIAFVVGGLTAAGCYLMLRRSIVKIALGIVLLSHAANLLIFSAAGMTRGNPPIVPEGATALEPPYADPLPQALILTAIVIGFGVQAFALVLIRRTYETVGTDDTDELRTTEN